MKEQKNWGLKHIFRKIATVGEKYMSKADEYLYQDMKNILEYGFVDENPRPKYADGKPTHTISVNQVLRKYDLSKGEFPICSLRPIASITPG